LKSLCIETPIIEGNKKKIKTIKPLNTPLILIGELTIREEPVVPVIPSQIPAEVEDRKKARSKNIEAYM
jgi:hypothetical protein